MDDVFRLSNKKMAVPEPLFCILLLWSERGVRLSTKIKVYCKVVLSTLLYGCETWTVYRPHVKKLEQFHMRCLRKICGVTWKDKITNTEILRRCNTTSIEHFIMQAQLRWVGHVSRTVMSVEGSPIWPARGGTPVT